MAAWPMDSRFAPYLFFPPFLVLAGATDLVVESNEPPVVVL